MKLETSHSIGHCTHKYLRYALSSTYKRLDITVNVIKQFLQAISSNAVTTITSAFFLASVALTSRTLSCQLFPTEIGEIGITKGLHFEKS